MDGEPRWGRGWISLGLWIGLESVLFLSVLAVGIFGPAAVSAVRGDGAWVALGPHLLGLGWVVATERRRLLSRLRPSARSVGLGVAAGAAMIVVGGGWSWLLEAARVEIPDVAQTLRGLVPSQALLLLWGAALVPFVEEAWFRGRFLDAVRDRLDARWALLLTSVLFAAVHGIAVFVPAYVAMAAILFALRERTGGLVAPIVAHAVNNAWGLLIPS